MRRGDRRELEPTTWDEAIAAVAATIRKAPAKTHVLGGDPSDDTVHAV